ncbi:MAG TPA: hypothetical protein VFG05_08005 [Methylocella sp.]|nr:hypothetical protein [Methylocella sp.]
MMADPEEEVSKPESGPGSVPGSIAQQPVERSGQPLEADAPNSVFEDTAAAGENETAPSESLALDAESPSAVGEDGLPPPAAGDEDGGKAGLKEPDRAAAPSLSAHADSPPPPPVETRAKRASLFPALALTAIAGAALGFGGTLLLRYFEGPPAEGSVSGENLAEVSRRIDAAESKEAALSADLRQALAALESRLSAVEGKAGKAEELANLAEADAQKALAMPPPQEPASGASPVELPDLKPLEERIAALEQKLGPLEAALSAPKTHARAEQERETPAASQASRAQAVAVVAASLLHTVESGGKFAGEVAALEKLGVPRAALEPLHGIPNLTVASERHLSKQFAALAPKIIASESAKAEGPEETFLDRLTRHAKGLVHVHRVGDGEAGGVEGIVGQIENALAASDLEAAYKAWTGLPAPAANVSEEWAAAVKARLDALNAAKSIEADALAALGKPKS